MTEYVGSLGQETFENAFFRQVIYTGVHTQPAVMCLGPGEELGGQVHPEVDQFFRIEQGEATFVSNHQEEREVRDGDAVVVPAGAYHNLINRSKTLSLKLYTLYSPPIHPEGTVHKTRAEADNSSRRMPDIEHNRGGKHATR